MHNEVAAGLEILLDKDSYLLTHNVNERSITHRLGMYYQSIFRAWDVDCEFNRNLNGPKKIEIDPSIFLNQMADMLDKDKAQSKELGFLLRDESMSMEDFYYLSRQLRDPDRLGYDQELDVLYFILTSRDRGNLRKQIYPDIIVHKRGTTQNYLVMEAKKSSNNDRISRAYDLVKLITLVTSAEYKYGGGYFIDIPTDAKLAGHKKFVFTGAKLEDKVYLVKSSSR